MCRALHRLEEAVDQAEKAAKYQYNGLGHRGGKLEGSPIRIEDDTGRTRESYGYGAFGEDLYGNQGEMQPFGYTGYQMDAVAGTYYAQAREYRAERGRFNSQDIIGGFILFPDTLNRYAYCWNAPIDYVDNDGEFPTIAIGALIGGVVGGIGSIISDVAKGKKINWGKAGKNALKGAAAGAVIGTGVGAVGALSTAGASTVAVNTAVAATAGASYRAAADIVAGDMSSMETYAGNSLSTAFTGKLAKAPSLRRVAITILGVGGTQALEQIGGIEEHTVSDYMSGMTKNIMISAAARFLSYILPDKWVQEDEFTPILDGLIRRIEEACDG